MKEGLTEKTSLAKAWWILLLTKLPRYKFLIRKLWWVLLLTTASGLAISAWQTSNQPVVFVSTGRMMISGKVSLNEGATYNEDSFNFIGTQLELMKSTEVRKRAAARVASLHPDTPVTGVNLDASQLRGTAFFVLQATGGTSDYTQQFLDACMEEYINIRKETRSEKSDTALTLLTDELGRIEKEIRAAEDEMLDFQTKNKDIGFLQEEGNSAGAYLASLNRQLADLRTEFQLLNLLDLDQNLDRNLNKKGSEQASSQDASNAKELLGNTGPEADYLQAKQAVEVLKIKRDDLAKVLRPKHPDMIALDQEIERQESLIATFRTRSLDELKTRRESIRLQIENLEGVVKEWETKALELSQKMAEYNNIKSKAERAKGVRERLLANLRSLDVNKNVDQDVVTIVEHATPAAAIRMGMLRGILIGLGFGAVLGIGILFVCDQIDDRISSFPEYQSFFSEPALTQVPKVKSDGDLGLLKHNDPRHAFVESFRALRSSIYYLPVEGTPPKVFLITSAVPDEGKTTVSSNLAITLSFAGAKTLLIDADLRRGYLHQKFGITTEQGLGQVLRGEMKLSDVICPTGMENLWLVPRGAVMEHPGEKFLSKVTDELLKSIYDQYDYIVIDSAPVLVADDTTSLAPKVDAVVFVVRFSYSSARNCNEALDFLKKRGANVIGLVCNDVDIESHNRYYSYYYSRYTDYYANAPKQGV